MAKYYPNNVEFARFIKSDEIGSFIKGQADRLAAHLRATAPRSNRPNKTDIYANHFRVETGLDVMRGDRSAAFVINDSPYATVLEVGSARITNPPQPMTKVLDAFSPRTT